MPYRRLPNTDTSRLRALQTSYEQGFQNSPADVAYSQKSYTALKTLFPQFRDTIIQHKSNIREYNKKNKIHTENVKRIRIYISHFIQVVDMAIVRGEQLASIREFYGLNTTDLKLPKLKSDEDLVKWGSKIIEGESIRIRHGNSPITNPTIALVKVNYEKFLDTYRFQETVRKSYARSHKLMDDNRKATDKLIQTVWNEVEAKFASLGEQAKREASEKYGISYVFRKSELLEKVNESKAIQASEADDHAVTVKPKEGSEHEIKAAESNLIDKVMDSETFVEAAEIETDKVVLEEIGAASEVEKEMESSESEFLQPISKKSKKKKEKESDSILELKLF